METAVANLVEPGRKVLVVVTGYFGLRLADLARRSGAEVRTVECEWGRAIDPAAVESALAAFPADVVAIVHAETSTGVRNPVREVAALAHARGVKLPSDSVDKVMAAVDGLPEDATSSMHRDIAAGKPSELDSQNGAVVRMAREIGVDAPTHTQIYETLKRLERHE